MPPAGAKTKRIFMLNWFGKYVCPIGVDLGNGFLRMAQIGFNGSGPYLHAAGIVARPQGVEPQSPAWQRWAIDAIKDLLRKGDFKGKSVITALASEDLFIEQMKVPYHAAAKLDEVILPRIQKKLPFTIEEGMIHCIPVEIGSNKAAEVDVIVIAAERRKIDRHLAIYENAGLDVAEMSIWPTALINSYHQFFCRRKTDQNRVVILLDVGSHFCNVVIGCGGELLFARLIPTGYVHLSQDQTVQRLMAEVDSCCHYFETIAEKFPIEQILLLVGKNTNKDLCDKVVELAQKMQISAQIGDVLLAVQARKEVAGMVERRNSNVDWAVAFGLSLEGMKKK
jgi:Tfp pilus assembly PilM family ATPase